MYKGMFGLGEVGENLEEKNPEIEAKIRECINICDNLVFSDYLTQGGDKKSSSEIKRIIKDSVFQSLVDFFGEEYFDQIFEKIHGTSFDFNYSLCGDVNSVEKFISKKQNAYFLQKYGIHKGEIDLLDYDLENIYKYDAQELLKDKEVLLKNTSFKKCLEAAGFDEKIFTDGSVEEIEEFINKIRTMSSMRNISDIPEVERDVQKIIQLLEDAKIESYSLTPESKGGESLKDVLKSDVFARYTSCVIDEKQSDIYKQDVYYYDFKIFEETGVSGFYHSGDQRVCVGMDASDWLGFHEFLHSVTGSGFKRENVKRLSSDEAKYSNQYTQNQMLDEAIIDYLTSLIIQQRKENGEKAVISDERMVSSYSLLFPLLGGFIDDFLPEIKKALMSSTEPPSVVLARVIGKDNLDKLALGCNELIGIMQTDLTKKTEGMTSEEVGEFVNGEFERIIGDIDDAELAAYGKSLINDIREYLKEEEAPSEQSVLSGALEQLKTEIKQLRLKVMDVKAGLKVDVKWYIKTELERIKSDMFKAREKERLKTQRQTRKMENQNKKPEISSEIEDVKTLEG